MSKRIIIILLLPIIGFSQTKTMHLVKYENNINPIFSKVLKHLSISLDKISLIDSLQYQTILKIDLSDRKSELNGISNEISIGNHLNAFRNYGLVGGLVSSSLSTSKLYSFKNTIGSVLLTKVQFDSLYRFSEKIMSLLDEKDEKIKFDMTYYFNVDKIEMTLEVLKKKNSDNENVGSKQTYYVIDRNIFLRIDDAIFGFNDSDFKNFYNNTLSYINSMWDNNK